MQRTQRGTGSTGAFPLGSRPWNGNRDVGGGEESCPPASCLELTASSLSLGLRKWVCTLPLPPAWAKSVFCAAKEGGQQTDKPCSHEEQRRAQEKEL